MSPRAYQFGQIICAICSRQCRAELKDRNICRECFRRSLAPAVFAVDSSNMALQRRLVYVPAVRRWRLDQSGYALAAYVPGSSTIKQSSCARLVTTPYVVVSATRTSRPRSSARSAVRCDLQLCSGGLFASRVGERSTTVGESAQDATGSRSFR